MLPLFCKHLFLIFRCLRRGKVRDVYSIDDDRLLIVATDRISAFDCVLPTPIERKGEVLTALSQFWFEKLGHVVANHLLTSDVEQMPEVVQTTRTNVGPSFNAREAG